MTVTQLVGNFRDALAALVPMCERLSFPWRRPDAYDEWDRIATAVYRSLVDEVLRWELPEDLRDGFALAEYDSLSDNYSNKGLLMLKHPGRDLLVLHALGTDRDPFDVVECRRLDPALRPLGRMMVIRPLESARFALVYRTPSGRTIELEDIRLP